jgi:hypothetical protein
MKYQYILFTLAGVAMAGGAGGYGKQEYVSSYITFSS